MEFFQYKMDIIENSSAALTENIRNYTFFSDDNNGGNDNEVYNITDADTDIGIGIGRKRIEASISLTEFLFCGVGLTLIALVGLVGNTISIIVLARPRLRSSVTFFFLGLTLCDTIVLLYLFLTQGLKALIFEYLIGIEAAGNFFKIMSNYFGFAVDCAQSGSVYFTIAIAFDRYIAVCWPFKSKYLCSWRRAQYVSGGVLLTSIAFQAFGYFCSFPAETTEEKDLRLEHLQTVCNISMKNLNSNSIFLDTLYENHFLRWPYLIFMVFIPFLTLTVLNSFIYNKIRKVNLKRQNMTKKQASEISFAVVCILILVMFIVCNSALVVMAIVERFCICFWHEWKLILLSIDCFLVSLNSAINFFIYCAMGENFRQQLKQIINSSTCGGGGFNNNYLFFFGVTPKKPNRVLKF